MHDICWEHIGFANDLYSTAKEYTENHDFYNTFKSLFLEEKEIKEEGAYQRGFDNVINHLNSRTYDFMQLKPHIAHNPNLMRIHKIAGEMMLDLNYWSAIETHRYSKHWKHMDIKVGHIEQPAHLNKIFKKTPHNIISELANAGKILLRRV